MDPETTPQQTPDVPAAPAPTPPAAAGEDPAALRRQVENLQSQLAAAHAAPQVAGRVGDTLESPAERRERLLAAGDDLLAGRATWPDPGYDGPAPWEIAHAYGEERLSGEELRAPYDGPGAVTHSYPLLTTGAVGAPVAELVALLARAGYANNSVAQGENPGLVLDNTVMADVRRFMNDWRVANNPDEYEGREAGASAVELAANHVGPYVWQALIEVAERRDAERQAARERQAQAAA